MSRNFVCDRISILVLSLCLSGASSFAKVAWADLIVDPQLQAVVKNQQRYRQAQELVLSGDLSAAGDLLEDVVAEVKDVPHSQLLLAQILLDNGAKQQAQRLLEVLSSRSEDQFEASWVFCKLAVQQERWFDGWAHAVRAETIEMPSRWSDEYRATVLRQLAILKGRCCEGRTDWTAAIAAYDSIVSANEKKNEDDSPAEFIQALAGLGRAEFHLEHTAQAVEWFEQLRQAEPSADPPELMLAVLFEAQGDQNASEHWFRLAIALPAPDGAIVGLRFAKWLIWNNRPDEASPLLEKSLDKPEQETERLYLTALIARMRQQYTEAQDVLSTLHQQHATAFMISNQLALVLIESGEEANRGRALQIAEANVRNYRNQAEAWSTLGWIQLRLGDVAKAQETLAVAARPGAISRDTAYFIAKLKEATGDSAGAAEFYKVAAKMDGPIYYGSRTIEQAKEE